MKGKISKSRVSDLLKQNPTKRDDLKLGNGDTTTYYLLDNGVILLCFQDDDFGIVFPSESDLRTFRKQVESQNSSHILKGVFISEEFFFQKLCQVENEIGKALGIHPMELNSTFESLNLIDAKLKDISIDNYFKKVYSSLICYLGKVIIHDKGGEWKLLWNDGVLEPYVKLSSTKLVNVFIDLFEFANEDYENFSSFTISQLRLDRL